MSMRRNDIPQGVTRQVVLSQVRQGAKVIVLTEFEAQDVNDLDEKWLTQIAKFYAEPPNIGYSLMQDGKAIASAGLVIDAETKTAHAWGSVTDKARANPRILYGFTKRILALEMDKNQIESVTVLIKKTDERSQRWIRHLGFEHEPEGDFLFYRRRQWPG